MCTEHGAADDDDGGLAALRSTLGLGHMTTTLSRDEQWVEHPCYVCTMLVLSVTVLLVPA